MRTCLVTGGAGFIGSHLATRLVDDGWKVRVLDNLSTGKRDNVAHLQGRITFLEGDVRDPKALAVALRDCQVVYHLAALVSVPLSVKDPVAAHEICATGTLQVLLAAQTAGVRRLVYSASSSAYGDDVPCPTHEQNPVNPKSPYAAAKLAGEHYCTAFSATSSLQTVRLRYFNVFGPRQDPSSPYSGVISIFCSKLLKGEVPTIFGDGQQTRDFVFVEDVVQANRLAAEVKEAEGKVFNIGCGRRYTLLELLETVKKLLGSRIEPQFAPPRVGDVIDSQADIALAERILGYHPKVSLETGLARCLDYYKELMHRAIS